MASSPPPRAPRKARPRVTLKMQAIGYLSRREYSRQELRLKLLAALAKARRLEQALAASSGGPDHDPEPEADSLVEVDTLLDWLEANAYLSDARFVESRVNVRAPRLGTARIRHELSRHGLSLAPEQSAALRDTEFARAQAIWQRKFGEPAPDARERARQGRFLMARGFSGDIVRRVIGGADDDS